MQLILFASTLLITITIVAIAMAYLRKTTREVIKELCKSDSGAEFWLRSADIMAYSGCIMLVLIFGKSANTYDWIEAIRTTLILTLAGLFTTVLFVSRNVWNTANKQQILPERKVSTAS